MAYNQPTQAPAAPAPAMPTLPAPRFVRAQEAEETSSPALQLPSPEDLGVKAAGPAHLDWTGVHQRLERLNTICFHLEKFPNGGCRFTCVLPTSQPDRSHRIEVAAATEVEAVRQALDEAEAWKRTER